MFPERMNHISVVVMQMKTIINYQIAMWSAMGVPVVGLVAAKEMTDLQIQGISIS